MIRLIDVWFRYDGSDWVLRGVSLEVREARLMVVEGANGAGKTTLLKVIGLLLKPQSGRVVAWGRDFWRLDAREALEIRRRVVYVHEKPILASGSVAYNIALGLLLRGVPRENAYLEARRVAEQLGLTGILDKPVRSLSRGQAQLVAIARAVAVKPRILLLDEPTAHLDSGKKMLVQYLIQKLVEEGVGVVVATHDHWFAESLGGERLVVKEGVVKGSVGAHHSPSA